VSLRLAFFVSIFLNTNIFVDSLNAASTLSHLSSRILVEEHCNKATIQIRQAATIPLPNGIPQYRVEIANTCVTGCNITNIHVPCGKCSSARLVNPTIFKRLSYNDCLVNDGKLFPNGKVITFVYANTYSYSLSVSTLTCH
jgi:hypothetical protein